MQQNNVFLAQPVSYFMALGLPFASSLLNYRVLILDDAYADNCATVFVIVVFVRMRKK